MASFLTYVPRLSCRGRTERQDITLGDVVVTRLCDTMVPLVNKPRSGLVYASDSTAHSHTNAISIDQNHSGTDN